MAVPGPTGWTHLILPPYLEGAAVVEVWVAVAVGVPGTEVLGLTVEEVGALEVGAEEVLVDGWVVGEDEVGVELQPDRIRSATRRTGKTTRQSFFIDFPLFDALIGKYAGAQKYAIICAAYG